MKFLDKIFGDIYLHYRLLRLLVGVVFLFCVGFPYPIFIPIAKILFAVVVLLVIVDLATLFTRRDLITGERILEEKLSNGDANPIILRLTGMANFNMHIDVVEEFPKQLQLRDSVFQLRNLQPGFDQEVN